MSTTLHLGDSREILAGMPENSVDSVVSDPPYEIDFMAAVTNGWDSSGIAFDPTFWAQVRRVLKPGGHLVSFGACRTYHRIAVGIEDGGFQIRDCLQWIFGSGFPKSMNIAFAIEKELAKKLEKEHQFTAWMRTTGVTAAQLNEATGTNMGSHYLTAASQPSIPTGALMDKMRHLLPEVPEWIEAEIAEREERKAENRDRYANPQFLQALRLGNEAMEVTRSEAKEWAGWGTALKPAYEPIILARKPLPGTVAASVLEHGTGALNIEATRVGDDIVGWSGGSGAGGGTWNDETCGLRKPGDARPVAGRWPPNVLVSPEAAKKFGDRANYFPIFDWSEIDHFFYAPKASREEREAGCDHLPARTSGEATARKEGSAGINNPRAGAGRTAGEIRNFHPTVKPVSLMRWLCKLITPPGGVVLDPFAGSGTTGIGAIAEGFDFIGIEMDPGHHSIAMARLEHAGSMPVETNREDYAAPSKKQLGFFG